ncbi:hypothetical protein M3C61_12490 [Dermacoccus abyssi]|uniref:hypothetical protein n=1 Tax=Dermacoccus abyssi TaxID=322596 RepID=UPI0021A38B7E|nr:hypothetical protein [Dermacoccus abyssi]MCT1987818.1 hypothetical protein [Dermacoccus abyssi]
MDAAQRLIRGQELMDAVTADTEAIRALTRDLPAMGERFDAVDAAHHETWSENPDDPGAVSMPVISDDYPWDIATARSNALRHLVRTAADLHTQERDA